MVGPVAAGVGHIARRVQLLSHVVHFFPHPERHFRRVVPVEGTLGAQDGDVGTCFLVGGHENGGKAPLGPAVGAGDGADDVADRLAIDRVRLAARDGSPGGYGREEEQEGQDERRDGDHGDEGAWVVVNPIHSTGLGGGG